MLKEIKEHSFYEEKLRPEITIVDLGACKGEFTEAMNSLYKVKKAVLVEANPTNFKVIPKRDNYILYNKAVSSKDGGTITFLEDPNSPYNGTSVFNYFSSGIKHEIECISLHKIMEENAIDYIDILKIDIEGSEYELLESLEKDVFDKIEQITVEFHDFIDPNLKTSTEKLLSKIESFGFSRMSKPISYMHGSEHYDVLLFK